MTTTQLKNNKALDKWHSLDLSKSEQFNVLKYRGHIITFEHNGEEVVCVVDGDECGVEYLPFFITTEVAAARYLKDLFNAFKEGQYEGGEDVKRQFASVLGAPQKDTVDKLQDEISELKSRLYNKGL